MSFKITFAGTPDFAAVILQALIKSSHTIVAVYTQPDRPAGRGRHLTASPVKKKAIEHGLAVYQPMTLRDESEQMRLVQLQADVMVVVAYGLILPKPVLLAPRLGCINVHASLLPRWRGAAPIQRAILAGDTKTGISIMQMDEGLDTGPVFYQAECEIQENDTAQTLHDRLAALGADALLRTLQQLEHGVPCSQVSQGATYANKIIKEEAKIDWHKSAMEIARQVRAFNAWPIAFTQCGDQTLRLWEVEPLVVTASTICVQPGEIVQASSAGLVVATGKGMLQILTLQLPGGRPLPIAEIMHGHAQQFVVGQCLI